MKDNRLPEILHNSEMNSYFETIFNSNCTSKAFEDHTGLKWNLPVIIISDEEPIYKTDNILDGVLGIYFLENKWKSEGRIVLYHKNIRKASNEIAKSITIDPEFVYISLTKIVLLHELGHWIHHWKLPTRPVDKTEEDCHYNINFKDQSTELKESIAQYYVWLAIHDKPEELIFDELLKDQGDLYKGHKELIKQGENGKLIIENYIINYELLKNVLTEEDILKVEELKPIEKQDELIGIITNPDNIGSFKTLDFIKPFISNAKWEDIVAYRVLKNGGF
jgi:hypothetical protein